MGAVLQPGSELRSARERAGLTQRRLAALTGTSQATISAYEAGRKQPSVATLARLLAATGTRLRSAAPAHVPAEADLRRAGERLEAVLALAEALPYRPRPEHYPLLPVP